ncbi:MAG: ATP-binding cassette domain-containing protein [Colwellia sp.]|nr:ATP-binding cassette domain-containing protein [Colwellia sp.]
MSLLIKNVTKKYNEFKALNKINLNIPEGETFGLMGSNGAGKTTTIRLILNILQPDEGEILWSGQPITSLPKGLFGYLPEERGLYPKMKVNKQLNYLAGLQQKKLNADIQQNVNYWLERLDVAQYRNKSVEQLSKGNQQKIQFIAAIAHQPKILILDEPFSGLDPVNISLIKESIKQLQKQGITLVISSHRLEQVEQLCSQVALIHKSKIVLNGQLEKIKQNLPLQSVRLTMDGSYDFLNEISGIKIKNTNENYKDLLIEKNVNPQYILRCALKSGLVTSFEIMKPNLNDVYLSAVKG